MEMDRMNASSMLEMGLSTVMCLERAVPHEAEDEGGDEDVKHENEDLLDDLGPVSGLGEYLVKHFTIN